MSTHAVTVLGHDRPGIIADVTARLGGLGLNLEDSSMTLLRGHFAMTLVCAGDVDTRAVESALATLADDGSLVVTVLELPREDAVPAVGEAWLLSVHGADRPGIVSAVVAEVAAVGGNVTDLSTRLAGDLYVLLAEIALPDDADADALAAAVQRAAASVGVIRAPDAVLASAGATVDPTDPDVVRLAADLVATMRVSPGCVGLAAPQVGVPARVFCVDVTGHPKTRTGHGTFVLCNAEVVGTSRNERAREGCMSVPDLTGDVKRATRLVARGLLPGTGEQVEVRTDAFEARALQHEIDHCDGLLFLDRVAGAHALHPRRTYL